MTVTVGDIRAAFPQQARMIDSDLIQKIIDGWASHIEKEVGEEWVSDPWADKVIRIGATADTREIFDANQGNTQSQLAQTLKAKADAELLAFDRATTSATEHDDGPGFHDVDETLIAGLTDAPSWPYEVPKVPVKRQRTILDEPKEL